MDATNFELKMSLPHDVRFIATIRDIAVHAAQYAGCAEVAAVAFGRRVEEVFRLELERDNSDRAVPIVVRRQAGPVEVLVDQRRIAQDV